MSPVAILSKDQVRSRYYVQTGSMWENPHGVPPATIREMEETLPPEVVAQVIYGMYVEASGLVFHSRALQQMFVGEELNLERWEEEGTGVAASLLKYKLPTGRRYFIGVDIARKNDYTVLFVFDGTNTPAEPARCVYYRRLNRVSWETIYTEIARAAVRFQSEALLDCTGMGGDVVLEELDGRFYCSKCDVTIPFVTTNGSRTCPRCKTQGHRFQVAGFAFSGRSKEQAITRLQQALVYGEGWRDDWGLLRMPRIRQVMDEMTFYRRDDKKRETDTVMALALVTEQVEFEEAGLAAGSVHG